MIPFLQVFQDSFPVGVWKNGYNPRIFHVYSGGILF